MFITVEGIKGSGRDVLASKLEYEFKVVENKRVHRIDAESDSFGSGLDAVVMVSDRVLAISSAEVIISTSYVDTLFAYYKMGRGGLSISQEWYMFVGMTSQWCFCVPDVSLHIDIDVADARKRVMALNSDAINVKADKEYCSNWDYRNTVIQEKLLHVRSKDRNNRAFRIDGNESSDYKWRLAKKYVFPERRAYV